MVVIRLTRGNTGRESPQWETDNPEDPVNQVHLLTAWLDAKEFKRAPASPYSKRALRLALRKAIRGLEIELSKASVEELEGTYFRGRPGLSTAPVDDFGPPPGKAQRRNRFNKHGQRSLYLAKIETVIGFELTQEVPEPGSGYSGSRSHPWDVGSCP